MHILKCFAHLRHFCVQAVPAPLPRVIKERQERKAGYEATNKDVVKWQPIVKVSYMNSQEQEVNCETTNQDVAKSAAHLEDELPRNLSEAAHQIPFTCFYCSITVLLSLLLSSSLQQLYCDFWYDCGQWCGSNLCVVSPLSRLDKSWGFVETIPRLAS
eukprot:1161798-Pelagomonas_calceolata.AAC.8